MKLENEKLYVKHQSGEGATLGRAAAALELKRKLLENSCLENFIQHKEKLEEEGGTDYGRPMKPFFIEIQNFWA